MSDELSISDALKLGIEAHKAGQVQEADRIYTAILKVQPKHPDANHNMGVLAVSAGKAQEALPFLKVALEANPSTAQFWLSYIDALVKLNRFDDAKTVFNQAKSNGAKGDGFDKLEEQLKEVQPASVTVPKNQDPPQDQLQSLINLYSQGQLQQALDKISPLLQKFSNSVTLYNIQGAANAGLGQLDAAIDSYNKAVSINPDFADAYNNKGNALQEQGKLDEAIEAYKKALAIKPDHADGMNNMGNALQAQGKLEEAIEAYSKVIAMQPDYAEAYYNMGNSLRGHGKLEKAIEAYSKALAITPDYAEAYNNMGVSLQDQGKLDEAIEAFNKALARKPDYADAYSNIGNAFQSQGKLENAIEAFNKALIIKPSYAEAYSNMGNTLQEQGKPEEAIEAYNKALTFKPDYAEAHNNMGNTFREQGKLEEAIEAYNKALAIKPDYADAWSNMGITLQEQGKLEEAVEAYSKALTIKPDSAETYSNMGIALQEQGKLEEAIEAFKKDSSSKSQTYLLKCLYEQDEQAKFFDQLDYLIDGGENNAVIGSYISRAQIRYGTKKSNPFCNDPLKYIQKTDLKQSCDFANIFVKGATDILSEDIVKNRSQSLLTNGIQTTGNVFNQIGDATNKIQDIIRSEVENYRTHFKDSPEGLIKIWPSEYEIYGWLVSMKSGGKLAAHMHDNGWISGSIYINVPPKVNEDSGNLVVCLDSESDKNSQSIDVVTGSLCLFPSSLLHYTIPFEADENRIVLAFDVIPK